MGGTRTAKSNLGNVDKNGQQPEAEHKALDQAEERNLYHALQAEEEQQEEQRNAVARNEQQDLNQGMDTGTHGSVRHGVDWGSAYQTGSATTKTRQKNVEPQKESE